ncbi:MAG: hypothetical protein U0793_24145 [Gemmataceae bacterium]
MSHPGLAPVHGTGADDAPGRRPFAANAIPALRRWWRVLLLALGMSILLHGCHGEDEDHELFQGATPALTIHWTPGE